jgi:hypothetical protein
VIADVLEDIVRVLIEDGVRVVGLVVLKVITLGRYRSGGRSMLLVEGAIGLVAIAGALGVVMRWVW